MISADGILKRVPEPDKKAYLAAVVSLLTAFRKSIEERSAAGLPAPLIIHSIVPFGINQNAFASTNSKTTHWVAGMFPDKKLPTNLPPQMASLEQRSDFGVPEAVRPPAGTAFPSTNEILVHRLRPSALQDSDLPTYLRARDIKHIVICGLTTAGTVLGTARQAADNDYHVILPDEANWDDEEEVHRFLFDRVLGRHADCVKVADHLAVPGRLTFARRRAIPHLIPHRPGMDAAQDAFLPAEGAIPALFNSFMMIIFSEIGDKTFLIAAILAMRHPRAVVFAGAFGSLVVMSILSAAMGHILPTLIPKQWTQVSAAGLFLVFGAKMMMEARAMKAGNEKIQEEMREAQEEIEGDDAGHDGTGAVAANGDAIPLEAIEEGGGRAHPRSPTSNGQVKVAKGWGEGARNFCSFFLGPVFVQAFILTFLGEWGDRSQIATIALGAAHNVYLVTAGTVLGHSMCTALAVIGGRYVSTKISVKHVTFGGSVLFLMFGVIYLYEAFATDMDHNIPGHELTYLDASPQLTTCLAFSIQTSQISSNFFTAFMTSKTSTASSGKRVVIIGAGLGGLSTAIALKRKLGYENFTIFEKASDVGGTWRENTYPGCGSDVEVHLYSHSAELKPDWNNRLATQPELLDYWRDITTKHDLRKHISFNTHVVSADWDSELQLYHVRVQTVLGDAVDERVLDAEIVISAIGMLEQPRFPDIEGMGEFKGEWFHSARWEHDVQLAGKRVAVLGNGSSASQFVPKITADPTVEVVQFVRTPSWYTPVASLSVYVCVHAQLTQDYCPQPVIVFSNFRKWIFAHVPGVMRMYRNFIYLQREILYLGLFEIPRINRKVKKQLLQHLRRNAPEEYHTALTPDFSPGCKRLLVDGGYLRALNRPNVSLKFGGVTKITASGVETKDGEQIPFDVVIFATGFTVDKYPIHISGVDGTTIQKYYDEHGGPTAYRGTAIPGLPNFYMVSGHTSVIFTSEVQINYIVKMIAPILSGSASSFEVTVGAADRYNAKIQRRLAGSVLTQCVSWYRAGGSGKVTSFFPGPTIMFWWWLRKPVWADYKAVAGEKWENERKMKRVKMVVRIAALVAVSVGLSRNWEALGARSTWESLKDKSSLIHTEIPRRNLLEEAKVFNNHLLIDTAAALYERTDPGYQPLRKALRDTIFTSLASYHSHGTVIFTEWQSSDAEGTATAQSYLSAALSRRTPTAFISVILTCSEWENIRRLNSGTRGAGNTKLTDVAVLKAIRAYAYPYRFGSIAGVTLEVEVDVTEKTPEETAAFVLAAIGAVDRS
ncbi:hypothetical protein HWV62_45360 [Athelia sp. TMB]|nr:hypothetical protein HWV62_45360 [Athelia sp. TMB]